jgi:hypothetical protein
MLAAFVERRGIVLVERINNSTALDDSIEML